MSDNVGASIPHELLLSATVVKLKNFQVIFLNRETANLSHNSQFTGDFKRHNISSISKLYQIPRTLVLQEIYYEFLSKIYPEISPESFAEQIWSS